MVDQIDINQIANTLQTKVDLPDGSNQTQIDFVVEWKMPTENDPTWYRLYKSGWIEQGGVADAVSVSLLIINLPRTMADTNYTPLVSPMGASDDDTGGVGDDMAVLWGIYSGSYPYGRSTTQLRISTNSNAYRKVAWMVRGIAASH